MKSEIKPEEFTRLANNFYNQNGLASDVNRIALDSQLVNYVIQNSKDLKNFKVALCFISLNAPYWQYAKDAIEGAKQMFLPGHKTDFFLWSDIPTTQEGIKKQADKFKAQDPNWDENLFTEEVTKLSDFIQKNTTLIETAPIDWPMGTLMRFSLMLQQEEKLKDYDYIFYCDIDMRFLNVIGDEILGETLTVAPHPGYYINKIFWPPYEPNPNSKAYIKRPGIVINDEGKPRFMPYYCAGGFQGGKAKNFLKAMRAMKKNIDDDFTDNYIAIWNDESHWNKYIFDILDKDDLEKVKFLTPSYIYPDSLIEEYYVPKVWGQNFQPKLMTLTKPFTVSKEGGEAVAKMLGKI